MTYCVGMLLNRGLVFMSDTRTNAGVDNISSVRKMFCWEEPGERFITIMTAGNLATTQAVVSLLNERTKIHIERNPSILEAPTMFQVARIVGQTLREVLQENTNQGLPDDGSFSSTLIVGGQVAGGTPQLYLIYPEGNFVEATDDTPFFQIGETKYGKPILIRAYDPDMSFEDAVKLLCVSFDSTVQANLSVGMPFDIQTYEKDSMKAGASCRLDQDSEYYRDISSRWGDSLRQAFKSLPDFKF